MAKKSITIDDLARMVQNGFLETRETTKKIIKKEVDILKEEVGSVKEGVGSLRSEMNQRFNRVEQSMEDIKLRQDNVAYRFELRDVEKRVTLLEKKAGFR